MPTGPYDLTTVAAVEAYGNITASTATDARIQAMITAMTDRMERECSRKFLARDFTEWYNVGGHQEELVLKNYPLIRAPGIFYGELPCMTVSYSGSSIEANISAATDRMTLTYYNTSGTRTQTDFLYSTYASVSALATAIGAVSGFTATVNVNLPSFRICPMSGFDLLVTPGYVTYPNLALRNPAVDYDTGVVANRFWQVGQWQTERPRFGMEMPRGFQYILAEYRAGYEVIPADLAMLCNELVVDVYNRSNKDATLQSERLGDYSYQLCDLMQFNQSVRERLSRYMRYAVGGV